MVKRKTGNFQIFTGLPVSPRASVLPLLGLLTFIFSWIGAYPSGLVERWYAHSFFVGISKVAGRFADSVPFAWLDVGIPAAVVLVVVLIWKRRWSWLVNIAAVGYLVFFWSWGLNYHRPRLASKLQTDVQRSNPDSMDQFARRAASELNRLYGQKEGQTYDDNQIRTEAAQRVRRVVAIIDGANWQAAHRIKISYIGNVWMRAAGIDGVFNPLAHEPIVNQTVLDIERPFIFCHE